MPLADASLGMFTGTDNWWRVSRIMPNLIMTDGVKYVADNGGGGGAYWLLDLIASYQPKLLKNQWAREYQFWNIEVNLKKKTAVVTCRQDSGRVPAVTQKLKFTDLDVTELEIRVEPMGDGKYCLLLPSEH